MLDYLLHLSVLFSIMVTLCVSLDLLAGHAGLLSLTHAAFYGIGAYATAILTTQTGLASPVSMLIGAAAAALLSLTVSLPSLRLRNEYFLVSTFGFQVIFLTVAENWTDLTQGPLGIARISKPVVFGLTIDGLGRFAALSGIVAGVAYLIVWRLSGGAYGRVLHALRESEPFAQSLGKNTLSFKLTVFAISAALAAVAGSLYAHHITYVEPKNFTVSDSILIVSMIVVGGMGSLWGPLLGAALLVGVPEILRFAGFPVATAGNLRQIVFGALLVLTILYRPQGLAGSER